MGLKSLLLSAVLIASAAAQKVSTYTDSSGRSISVNIPDASASSGSGTIFFQINVPKGTQWLAFGQGTQMNGAQMFVVYNSGTAPVLSPRTGKGHNMPQYDSSIKAKILSGSGVNSDGSMVVNVQCDSCLGSIMSATSTSSHWIMAYKSGSSLASSDTSATISQHDSHTSFTLDLTTGTGGSSANPFVAAASSSAAASSTSSSPSSTGSTNPFSFGSTSTSASASATSTNSVSQPVASTNPDSSSSSTTTSSSSDNTASLKLAHGVIMSLLFIGFFPLFALTLYLSTGNKVRYIHAPLQGLSVILLIVGMALGIVVGQKLGELDAYHQIIGFIVVVFLVIVQPTMGILQHLHFHKTGGRSMWGPIHQNLGRFLIVLGIVNGGLGLKQAGNTGGYIPYAVVAAIMFFVYVGVVIWASIGAKSRRSIPIDKEQKSPNGYEMQNTHRRLHSGNVQETTVQPKHDRV